MKGNIKRIFDSEINKYKESLGIGKESIIELTKFGYDDTIKLTT